MIRRPTAQRAPWVFPAVPTLWAMLVLLVLLSLAAACQGGPSPVGTYAAEPDSGPVSMTLEEDGRGLWKTGMEEIAFNWSLRDDTLVLHTRDGGIITGRPVEAGWMVTIPGAGEYHLRRAGP